MRHVSLLVGLSAVLALSACDSQAGADEPITGTFVGDFPQLVYNDTPRIASLVLVENESRSITGTGTITDDTGKAIDVLVSGVRVPASEQPSQDSFRLTFYGSGFDGLTYNGVQSLGQSFHLLDGTVARVGTQERGGMVMEQVRSSSAR